MKIRILTDSTSDLLESVVREHQIEVIPSTLVVDGISYADGAGLSRHEFYERMPSMKTPPTTAAPAIGEFETRYEAMLQACDQIYSIHPAASLTGTADIARAAAQNFAGRVHVIDGQSLSLGTGFQVLAAAEAAANGATQAQVEQAIHETRARLKVIALFDTLEYLRRSGRVSWARATIGGLLNLKPMVELVEGRVESLGASRTYHHGIERIAEMLNEQGPLQRLALLHTNAEDEARKLLALAKHTPQIPPFFVNVTTVIGAHVGPHAIGFVAVRMP
jgi:DegV family protein with EDD domain